MKIDAANRQVSFEQAQVNLWTEHVRSVFWESENIQSWAADRRTTFVETSAKVEIGFYFCKYKFKGIHFQNAI